MDFHEAISDAEERLAAARADILDLREALSIAEEEERALTLELKGMRSFARRLTPPETRAEPAPRDDSNVVRIGPAAVASHVDANPLSLMNRSEAVLEILRRADGPLNRNEIAFAFLDEGREDELDKISLALTGLKRTGRAESLGDGMWRLTTAAETPPPSPVRRLHER